MGKVKLPKKIAMDIKIMRKMVAHENYLFNKVFDELSGEIITGFDSLPERIKKDIEEIVNRLYIFMNENPSVYYAALVNGYEIELTPEEQLLQELYNDYEKRFLHAQNSSEKNYYQGVCHGITIARENLIKL